jgi:Outer membrane protein beta-barrel domain
MKTLSGLLLAFFLFAFFTIESSAQIKMEYGPKFGPNLSILRGDRPFDGMKKPKFGFSAGGFLSVRSAKHRRFQFEINLLYTQRGNNADYFNIEAQESELKSFSVGYLEVPIIFKGMLNGGGMVRPYVFGGPDYAGILHSTFKNGSKKTDGREYVSRDDLGILIGAGVTWFFLDRWYFADARYYHGIVNISESITKNLNPYDITLKDRDPIRGKFENNLQIGSYFNSTFTLTFGVSLARQSAFMMK